MIKLFNENQKHKSLNVALITINVEITNYIG